MIRIFSSILKNHKLSILLLSLMYISNDTLLFGTNSNRIFINIHFGYIVFLVLLLLLLSIYRKKLRVNLIFTFFLILLLSFFTMLFKDEFSFKYIYEMLLIFISMMIANLWPMKRVFSELSDALTFVSLASLFPFLINILYQPLLNIFPTFTNIAGYEYHNLFFGFVPLNVYNFNIYRNIAFFRESGVFGCFLNFNLFLLLFDCNKKSSRKLILNIIVTITTMSTGAIICMMFLLFIYFIYQKIGLKKILVFVVLCVSFLTITSSDYLNRAVFGKMNSNNISLYSRVASINSNLKIAIENPLFGVGWDNIEQYFESVSIEKYGSAILYGEKYYHNTNTLLKISSVHGIIFFIIYLVGFFKFASLNINKKRFVLLLFFALFLMFSYEDLTLNFIISLILFFGIKHNEGENNYENCRN